MNKDDYYYQHLQPNTLKDRDVFLRATHDIECSFTGRVDILTSGLHRFFLESSKLIRNAIKLYEEGVFDAAFYSVRTALELARVVAYFSNESEPGDSELYKSWRQGGKFPFDSTIRKQLEESGNVYVEIHSILKDFFDDQKARLASVQKYIHKQGYRTFYERGFTNEEREKRRQDKIAEDFYQFLKGTLTEIAFLRLCIDPFPILLRDSRVMYKVHFQGMTEPFSDVFVTNIIGEDKVEKYCTTEVYLSTFNHFNDNEQLTEEAHTLINNQYYNRKDWPVIERQMHLLSKKDTAAIKIFNFSNKVANLYMLGGWHWYFSDINSLRDGTRFSSQSLLDVKESDVKINAKYDEAYLSYFPDFDDDGLWIEHNEPLDKIDAAEIEKLLRSIAQ